MKRKEKNSQEILVSLVSTALLIALQVVLSRFLSIPLWNMKIGFSFVPVIIAARLFGPLGSVAVYAIGDIIGALLFPVGAYFPGFTLSAAISGLIFGLFLYKKCSITNMVLSSVLNQLFCSFLLNSFLISYVYGSPFLGQLAARWPLSLTMCVVQIVFMIFALERICAPLRKIIFRSDKQKKNVSDSDN